MTWRLVAIGVAAALALAWLWFEHRRDEPTAYYDSVSSTLATAQVIDGLALPAGTAIAWSDTTHTHLIAAAPPQPVAVFGLMVARLQASVDGGWAVRLAAPQSIDGWTCQTELVELTHDGHLGRCELAAGREWNGWPIPAATLVALQRQEGSLDFVLPRDAPVMSREIGRNLPATGGMTINADGSLDSIYFDPEAPLVLCRVALSDTVRWRYDAVSFGQGRARQAVAVSGATQAGDRVEVQPPGCR